jgi:hypothetical protein
MALVGASRSIRAGDHHKTNRMFRARIYAQGFTLLAIVAGSMYWKSDRQKRKEFETLVAERKAKEKQKAWLKELEARDAEEKELKAARDARRKGVGRGGVASSIIDERERRTGTLEMVHDLVYGRE